VLLDSPAAIRGVDVKEKNEAPCGAVLHTVDKRKAGQMCLSEIGRERERKLYSNNFT